MTRKRIEEVVNKYGYTFRGKTIHGYAVEKDGHLIQSPTLEGLYRCFRKWVIDK